MLVNGFRVIIKENQVIPLVGIVQNERIEMICFLSNLLTNFSIL